MRGGGRVSAAAAVRRAAVALALREILPHEHSLSEWVELASYVTGESGGYESADAARAALLDYFEE